MTTATKERKPTYKIFVLDSEEYDSLHRHYPMKKEDLEGSLGFAYGKTGEAFIRRTNVPEWDEATIVHEAEELLAKHSSHEDENNIRWKKGKNIFASVIPAVVGGIATLLTGGAAAPLVGALAGGLSRVGTSYGMEKKAPTALDIIGGGLSGLGGATFASGAAAGGTAAAPGFLSKAGGILKGGLLGTAPVGTTQSATSGLLGSGGKILGIGAAPAGSVTYPAGTPVGTQNMGTWSKLAPTGSPLSAVSQTLKAGESLGIGATLGSLADKTAYVDVAGRTSPYGVYGNPSIPGSAPTAPSSIAPVAQNVLGSAIGSGIGSSLASTDALKGMPSASGQGLAPSAKTAFQGANIIPTSLNAPANVTANLPAIQAPAEVAPSTGILSKLSKQAGDLITPKNILGGAMTLGSTMGKQPEFEPVDIESIRTTLLSGQGVTPLAQQARAKLSQIMSAKPGELYPTGTDAYYQSALRQTERAYSDAQKSLAKRYNLIDPNYLQNGEYQELARRLDQELASVKSDYAVSEEQRRFELSRTQQYQAIQQALQVDDNTMQELLGFTGLAADQAAKKYTVDVNDVNEMRKALGGLGGQILTSEGGILAGKK